MQAVFVEIDAAGFGGTAAVGAGRGHRGSVGAGGGGRFAAC
jgi:hypothetical protein